MQIIVLFVIGYALIAFEHTVRINKTATARLTGMLCWTVFAPAAPPDRLLVASHYVEAVSGAGYGGTSHDGHIAYVIGSAAGVAAMDMERIEFGGCIL